MSGKYNHIRNLNGARGRNRTTDTRIFIWPNPSPRSVWNRKAGTWRRSLWHTSGNSWQQPLNGAPLAFSLQLKQAHGGPADQRRFNRIGLEGRP